MAAKNHDPQSGTVFVLGIPGAEIFYHGAEGRIFSILAAQPAEGLREEKPNATRNEKTARKAP